MKFAAVFALAFCAAAISQNEEIIIHAGSIFTGTEHVRDAYITFKQGVIGAVSKEKPKEGKILEYAQCAVIPPFVDSSSFLLLNYGEAEAALSGKCLAADSVETFDDRISPAARKGGVLFVAVEPFSSSMSCGAGFVLRTGRKSDFLSKRAFIKFVLGKPRGGVSRNEDRYSEFQQLRSIFEAAQKYQDEQKKYRVELAEYEKKKSEYEKAKKEKPESKPEEPKKPAEPPKNSENEAMAAALEKKYAVRIETYFDDSARYALDIAAEFKFDLVIVRCAGITKDTAKRIADAKAKVILGPVFSFAQGAVESRYDAAAAAKTLSDAGVDFAVATRADPGDGYDGADMTAQLYDVAAYLVGQGVKAEAVLKAISSAAAAASGIESLAGRLDKGKRATFLVFSGEPFTAGAALKEIYYEGNKVYEQK